MLLRLYHEGYDRELGTMICDDVPRIGDALFADEGDVDDEIHSYRVRDAIWIPGRSEVVLHVEGIAPIEEWRKDQ